MIYTKVIKRKIANFMLKNLTSKSVYKRYVEAFFDKTKEEEIIVWVRFQKGLDKQQLLDYMTLRFNVSLADAERLFYIAYPDGLSFEEEEVVNEVSYIIQEDDSIDSPIDYIDKIILLCGDGYNVDNEVEGNPYTTSKIIELIKPIIDKRCGRHG